MRRGIFSRSQLSVASFLVEKTWLENLENAHLNPDICAFVYQNMFVLYLLQPIMPCYALKSSSNTLKKQ